MDEDGVLSSIELEEKTSLSDVAIPESRLLSDLSADTVPLKELPQDDLVDIYYESRFEARCVLCRSPFKTIAEHIYISNGWKAYAVMQFFKEYFNARVSWDCVDSHMHRHCDLSKLSSSGLKKLAQRQDAALLWQYRELDLAIAGIIDEIDEIKGMNLDRRPDTKLKRSALLRTLYRDLAALTKERDTTATSNINIQKILMEIWNEISDKESKDIIVMKVQEVQKILNG